MFFEFCGELVLVGFIEFRCSGEALDYHRHGSLVIDKKLRPVECFGFYLGVSIGNEDVINFARILYYILCSPFDSTTMRRNRKPSLLILIDNL